MLKRILACLIIGFFLSVSQAFSQADFRPGFIITLERDTIWGLINYQRDAISARICEFKESQEGKVIAYTPDQILAYRIVDGKFFVSRTLELEELSGNFFLEFLVDAIVSAYYIQHEGKNYYLLEDREGKFHLLSNEMVDYYTQEKGIGYRYTNQHIGIMAWLFSDHPGLQTRINRAGLNHRSIISIVSDYHQFACPDEDCIVFEQTKPGLMLRFGVSASFNLASFSLWGNNNIYPVFPFGVHSFPAIGATVEAKIGRHLDRYSLFLVSEFGKSHHQMQTELMFNNRTEEIDIDFQTTYLKTNLLMHYAFPFKRIQPTIGLGLTLRHKLSGQLIRNIYVSSDIFGSLHQKQDIKIPNHMIGPTVALGADIKTVNNQRINIGLNYYYHFMSDWRFLRPTTSYNVIKARYYFYLSSLGFKATYFF